MNPEGTAAELIVKQAAELSAEFAKIISDLIKSGAKNLAAILLAAVKPAEGQVPTPEQISGRQKIEKLLAGNTPALLEIPFADLKQFEREAKKFKLPYAIIENNETKGADVVIRAKDAELFNRVMERMGYGRVEFPQPAREQAAENPTSGAPPSVTESRREAERKTTASSPSQTTTTDIGKVVGKIEYIGADGEVLMGMEFHDVKNLVESAKREQESGTNIRVSFNELSADAITAVYELTDAGIACTVDGIPAPELVPEPELTPLDVTEEVRDKVTRVYAENAGGETPERQETADNAGEPIGSTVVLSYREWLEQQQDDPDNYGGITPNYTELYENYQESFIEYADEAAGITVLDTDGKTIGELTSEMPEDILPVVDAEFEEISEGGGVGERIAAKLDARNSEAPVIDLPAKFKEDISK